MQNLHQVIANNLVFLRRSNNLTQQELASKINYSDNAISRWERAEVTPTVETLAIVANFYGVSVSDLLDENLSVHKDKPKGDIILKRIFIALFSMSIVWIVAILSYIYIDMFKESIGQPANYAWLLFIAAIPITALVGFYYNRMWGTKLLNLIIWSVFTWAALATIYLYFLVATGANIWLIFILGVPAQFALILWFFIRR